jgi:hypothetical protein
MSNAEGLATARKKQMCQRLVAGLMLTVMCSIGPHAALSDQSWRIDEAERTRWPRRCVSC